LIINADDYGLTKGVSRGIRDAYKEGIVTSTTALMNIPGATHEIELALEETPGLQIGVHLNITTGKPIFPLEEIPSLVHPDGRFFSKSELMMNLERIEIGELEKEWHAQIQQCLMNVSSISHIDSHIHAATWRDDFWSLYVDLATQFHCAARLPYSAPTSMVEQVKNTGMDPKLISIVFSNKDGQTMALHKAKVPCTDSLVSLVELTNWFSPDPVIDMVKKLPDGVSEWFCHPGYSDGNLEKLSSYNKQRDFELSCLVNDSLLQAIKENNIELIGFIDIH